MNIEMYFFLFNFLVFSKHDITKCVPHFFGQQIVESLHWRAGLHAQFGHADLGFLLSQNLNTEDSSAPSISFFVFTTLFEISLYHNAIFLK